MYQSCLPPEAQSPVAQSSTEQRYESLILLDRNLTVRRSLWRMPDLVPHIVNQLKQDFWRFAPGHKCRVAIGDSSQLLVTFL
jgi:hypothetical protein